jgi:hypothetical protein
MMWLDAGDHASSPTTACSQIDQFPQLRQHCIPIPFSYLYPSFKRPSIRWLSLPLQDHRQEQHRLEPSPLYQTEQTNTDASIIASRPTPIMIPKPKNTDPCFDSKGERCERVWKQTAGPHPEARVLIEGQCCDSNVGKQVSDEVLHSKEAR